jgi:hypothetical protein
MFSSLVSLSTKSPLVPPFGNTNRVKVRNEVNTELNGLLCPVSLGDASFWPSTLVNIFLQDSHEPLKGEHVV